jgi:hypothetical protein
MLNRAAGAATFADDDRIRAVGCVIVRTDGTLTTGEAGFRVDWLGRVMLNPRVFGPSLVAAAFDASQSPESWQINWLLVCCATGPDCAADGEANAAPPTRRKVNLFIFSTPFYDLLYESLKNNINQVVHASNTTTWFTKRRCVNRVAVGMVARQHANSVQRVTIE